MSNHLYTVTLTDLGTYQVTVAAASSSEATNIAKTILAEEATKLPAGMTITDRQIDAASEPATELPVKQYRVTATYSIDFEMTLPAQNRQEAERHAHRLYVENCGPFEFDISDDRVGPFYAQEVTV